MDPDLLRRFLDTPIKSRYYSYTIPTELPPGTKYLPKFKKEVRDDFLFTIEMNEYFERSLERIRAERDYSLESLSARINMGSPYGIWDTQLLPFPESRLPLPSFMRDVNVSLSEFFQTTAIE